MGKMSECDRLRAENAELRALAVVARQVVDEVRATGGMTRLQRRLDYALDKVGSATNPHLPLPAWLFDEQQHASGPAHFLLAIEPDGGYPHTDGAHDDPAGVATARQLYRSIGVIAPPEGTRYLMLTVQPAPESGGVVNQEAIDNINLMAGGR